MPLVRLLSILASNQTATVSGSFNFPLKHPYLPARYPLSSKRRRTRARAKRNMLMSRLCVNNKNSSQRSHIFSSQPVHVCMSPTCILIVGHLLFWSYYMYAEYAYCEVGKQVRSLKRSFSKCCIPNTDWFTRSWNQTFNIILLPMVHNFQDSMNVSLKPSNSLYGLCVFSESSCLSLLFH